MDGHETMQSIDSNILSRIYGSGRGSVFTPGRFLDLGSRDAVDKVLSRLVQKGTSAGWPAASTIIRSITRSWVF